FDRLYGKAPTHVDGHQHMHLCANMLIDQIVPRGQKVRRNFVFSAREKGSLNRAYRHLVDRWLMGRYLTTDYFFDLSRCLNLSGLDQVAQLAYGARVELMTHPCRQAEYRFLTGDSYLNTFQNIKTAGYSH